MDHVMHDMMGDTISIEKAGNKVRVEFARKHGLREWVPMLLTAAQVKEFRRALKAAL